MPRPLDRTGRPQTLAENEDEQESSPFVTRDSGASAAFGPVSSREDEEELYSPWQPQPTYEDENLPPGSWSGNGTPEQIAFRETVLAEHIRRSRARSGPPRRDLADGERRPVAGTEVQMATAAAAAASRLIEAANRALVAARATASPDAVNTARITASSGYRGQEHQARVWRSLFGGYYKDTLRARQALPGGPHSGAAVRYMLDEFKIPWKVAAPGYSNHQAGIAIDLQQKRNPGAAIRNSTKPYWRQRWQATWFFAWLNKNAACFGFRPYTKEEWHWEYKPGGAQREDEVSELAFEADEDFYGSEAEDESFGGEEEGDTEATYEDEEAFAGQSAGEDESSGLRAEDNERYDPESEEESSGECATCGRANLDSEDARYEMEEAEDQFAECEDTGEVFEGEAPPIPVEKLFEVWKKGHKVAYRLTGRPEPRPFFYRAGMSTDYDGAPTAYHPRGRAAGALDHLANAGKPGNWWGIATTNDRKDGTPYIQQPGRPERDPNPGFYVSPTSLADTRFERTDTRRYVDSTKVPFIALPAEAQDRGKTPLRSGAKLGDLAAVVNVKNGRVAYAIFADSGPKGKIGEGSAALGNALGRKRSEELDLVYVVFPGSRKQPPWPLSVATIDREGARLFAQWGGVALVKRLVAPGMPLAKRPAAPARASRATVPTAPETETGSETDTEEEAAFQSEGFGDSEEALDLVEEPYLEPQEGSELESPSQEWDAESVEEHSEHEGESSFQDAESDVEHEDTPDLAPADTIEREDEYERDWESVHGSEIEEESPALANAAAQPEELEITALDGQSAEATFEEGAEHEREKAPTPVSRPAPNAVDAAAAEPIFSARVRAPEAPLLDVATLKLSSRWNEASHPKLSGITLAELRVRLERYLDRSALDDLVRQANAGAASPYGSDDATVVTLLAHQFQRKTCRKPTVGDITKPCTVGGRVAEDTLDALGFVYHAGRTLNTADQANRVAAATLGRLPASSFAGVEPGLTARTWWSYMVSPPWLGLPIKQGIHLVLLKRLRRAQRALMSLPAYAGLSPAELGGALGLEEEHKGARPGNTKWSMHLFGLAVDIGYTRNPWLSNPERDTAKLAAITLRAARLVEPSGAGDQGITAQFLHGLAITHGDTATIHKTLAKWSRWLGEYFALAGNAKRLEGLLPIANVIYPDGGWFKRGESLAQAAGRWARDIRTDFDDFAIAVSRGGNKNEVRHGFMDLARDLVTALRDEACLGWGAVDLGQGASGDIMHFDCRVEGIGRTIGKISGKPFVPESGHPCLPAGGSPPAQLEFDQPVRRKRSPAPSPKPACSGPTALAGRWLTAFSSRAIPEYKDKEDKARSTGCAINVPDALWMQKKIDLLVFFHGDPGPCKACFDPDPNIAAKKFGIDAQIHAAKRKVALAVPRIFWIPGSDDANIRGKWIAANLNKFVVDVLDEIAEQSGIPGKKVELGSLIIAGHSHAYGILTPLAREFNQGVPDTTEWPLKNLDEVWALDSTYGARSARALEAWAYALPKARFIAVLNKKPAAKGENPKPIDGWNGYAKNHSFGFRPPSNLRMCTVDESHCAIPTKYIGNLLSTTTSSPDWCRP